MTIYQPEPDPRPGCFTALVIVCLVQICIIAAMVLRFIA